MAKIRGAIYFLYMVLATLLVAAILWPCLLFGEKGARFGGKVWCQILLGGLKAITGVGARLEGKANIPDGPAIIAVNHQSMWETIYLFAILPKPAFVLKQELVKIPIFGWWLARTGSVTIDRSTGVKSIRRLHADAAARVNEGAQVVIFPEGTRSPVGSTKRFQPGVAAIYIAAKAPCTPVAHDSGRYWVHPGPTKIPGDITIRFLPAVPPNMDKRSFLERIENDVLSARPDLPADVSTKISDSSRSKDKTGDSPSQRLAAGQAAS